MVNKDFEMETLWVTSKIKGVNQFGVSPFFVDILGNQRETPYWSELSTKRGMCP
jgi:hypothetical protein